MKKLLSTNYSATAFNIALLFLRAGLGAVMIPRGYQKLIHFSDMRTRFLNFLGLGSTVSLSLAIFAETACALLLVLGLFTRFAALALVILTAVIVFKVNNGDVLGKAKDVLPLFLGFCTILLVGGGKYSIEGAMGK